MTIEGAIMSESAAHLETARARTLCAHELECTVDSLIHASCEATACMVSAAEQFLDRLGTQGGHKQFTFQTFADRHGGGHRLARVLHGTVAEHASTLQSLNSQGAGIFVMVNAGDGNGRKTANVTAVRALFVDLDGAPLEPVLAAALRPHIVVESSPGRWHAYWLMKDMPLTHFKPMQQQLASLFGGDTKVCDLPRVLRLPGFLHCKREPFLTRVIDQHDGPPYSCEEIIKGLGLDSISVAAAAAPTTQRLKQEEIPQGKRNNALFKIATKQVFLGASAEAVRQRLQRENAKRCIPPLSVSEVDDIAKNASARRSMGFVQMPHTLLDSPEYQTLPAVAAKIADWAVRKSNRGRNEHFSLMWNEFQGRHGLRDKGAFYAHRKRVVDAGILIQVQKAKRTQQGKMPDFYALNPRFLHVLAR